MKKQLSINAFKAALKRNNPKTCSLIYTKYGYYLITKKSQFYFRANTFIDRKEITDIFKQLGYLLCSQETFLNA